ncbi:FKBP-type peptidyl-prolyl cis-trans isomerase [Mucilaginibacter sp. RS28]|uniref:peptidylprolyl isomerase n=1 Tax=Mucilaginibacter straminoryzae TaxID=2932774 RepID=A0A9X1X5C5_9SPHI|nr:FKBP-type peptidyl-prolyl cis-trans isomerase [Mucilaginibacter straminoryzae]MCJ8211377.1 FKBP-type peptidyl-prolyl cis-trans isomerase [Mucilaginibacter straminoryzae]
MKKHFMFLAVAALGLASCGGGFKKGDDGVLYNIVTDKGGPAIQGGDFVSIDVVTKTDGDSVLSSSYDSGRPYSFPMPQKLQFKGDIYSVLMKMSEGDSAVVKINADSLFKKGLPKPPGFKGKYFVYEVKIDKVIQKGKLNDQVFAGRVDAYFKGEAEKLKTAEPAKIKKYLADNKIDATKTDSGLYYKITKPGVGPTPAKGDTVVISYVGKFLNGKVFDTNIKSEAEKAGKLNPMNPYQPIRLPLGQNAVIKGWEQGLMLLNKGAKATMVIPSSLGYGQQGYQIIGPYTPLAFDVEVVNIVHPNPNAPKPQQPALPPAQPQAEKK